MGAGALDLFETFETAVAGAFGGHLTFFYFLGGYICCFLVVRLVLVVWKFLSRVVEQD